MHLKLPINLFMPIYSVSLRWNDEAKRVGANLLGVVQNAI